MIVVSRPAGRSFKWLATYITTDPKSLTSDRVLFTHTLNLPFDDVGSAVDTMLRTYLARDILKKEAGIRPGGSSVEKPVKHIMLAWHVSERPTKDEMIAATESYLRAAGFQDYQCLLAGHADRKSLHVHVCLNMIHPERGTRLDDRFDRRRAQEWAAAYEKEHGKVFCTERLKPIAERRPSPPRNVWEELRELKPEPAPAYEKRHKVDYDAPARLWRRQEWAALKDQQKNARVTFFQDLVGHYRVYRQQIYNTTGVHFRPEWRSYFQLERKGASVEALKAVKDDIVARQKAQYQDAVREASPRLREQHDRAYQELLRSQKAERAKLIERQERGLQSPQLQYQSPRMRAAPGSLMPPMPTPASPHRSPERPFVWSVKAGMATQQRTAVQWLDRALDRLRRERAATPPSVDRGRPAPVQDRPPRKAAREKSSASVGIEPDGCGGSGL